MQYILTEDEYKNMMPYSEYQSKRNSLLDYIDKITIINKELLEACKMALVGIDNDSEVGIFIKQAIVKATDEINQPLSVDLTKTTKRS